MSRYFLDLHCHSKTSADGKYPIRYLLEMAGTAGMTHLAVTDHDRIPPIFSKKISGGSPKPELIRGIEISCIDNGRNIHLLGYFSDDGDMDVLQEYSKWYEIKLEKWYEACIKKVLNPQNKKEYIRFRDSHAGKIQWPCKSFFENELKWSPKKFLSTFFPFPNGPVLPPPPVPFIGLPIDEGVKLIRMAGGVAILAHPTEYPDLYEPNRLAKLISLGLEGLEIEHFSANEGQKIRLRQIAKQNKLLISGGSDFHDGKYQKAGITGDDAEKFLERLNRGRMLIPPGSFLRNNECLKRFRAVSRTLRGLAGIPSLLGVGLLGSVSLGTADSLSDIEVLIVTKENSKPVEEKLKKLGGKFAIPWGDTQPWCHFQAGNKYETHAIIVTLSTLKKVFASLQKGEQLEKQFLWFDLKNAKWIHSLSSNLDPIFSLLKENPFPEKFRKKAITALLDRWKSGDWPTMFAKAISRKDFSWQTWIRYGFCQDIIRACYYLNHSFLPDDSQLKWFSDHAAWMPIFPTGIEKEIGNLCNANPNQVVKKMNQILKMIRFLVERVSSLASMDS